MKIKKIVIVLSFIVCFRLFLLAEGQSSKIAQLSVETKDKIISIDQNNSYIKFTIKYSDLFDGDDFEKK
jgi:hypothetical protein